MMWNPSKQYAFIRDKAIWLVMTNQDASEFVREVTENFHETQQVLIVDDSQFMISLAAEILESSPHFEVVATAKTPEQALHKFVAHDPDVAIVDLVMPGMPSTYAVAMMRDIEGMDSTDITRTAIVAVGLAHNKKGFQEMAKAGVDAYTTKPLDEDDFLGNLHYALE